MILLGIDTASELTSVGLGKHGQPPFMLSFPGPFNQLEDLGLAVKNLLERSNFNRKSISAVALDVGPGLFTSLRVGVSFAKSFAGALGIPIIPLASLDLLAFSQKNCPKLVVSVVDAKRGEVFYAMYRRVPGSIVRVSNPAVASPGDVALEIESMREPTLLVGNGAIKYHDAFAGIPQIHFAGVSVAYPLMPIMLEVAQPLFYSEQFLSPENVEVAYIRDADAKVNFEVRNALRKDG